jgi:hypothetical protein
MNELRIKCPNLTCRKILAVPANSRGKNVRCKNCGATIRVPERLAAAPNPAPGAAKADAPAQPASQPKAA